VQCPDCGEPARIEDYFESLDLLRCRSCQRWWTPGEVNVDCANCGEPVSIENYNETFDFWTCPYCSSVWSHGENDPDFSDDSVEANEVIAEKNIQILNQWQPD
jgi:hypothetical protein